MGDLYPISTLDDDMGELGNKANIDLHTAIDARTGTAGQAMAGPFFQLTWLVL